MGEGVVEKFQDLIDNINFLIFVDGLYLFKIFIGISEIEILS